MEPNLEVLKQLYHEQLIKGREVKSNQEILKEVEEFRNELISEIENEQRDQIIKRKNEMPLYDPPQEGQAKMNIPEGNRLVKNEPAVNGATLGYYIEQVAKAVQHQREELLALMNILDPLLMDSSTAQKDNNPKASPDFLVGVQLVEILDMLQDNVNLTQEIRESLPL